MPSTSITEFAPAKVNLTLHVTGQRADGYHLLDSLVVFCGIGDRLLVSTSATTSLCVTGPFAQEIPPGPDNLVLRAANAFGADRPVAITLEKNLPPASGVGGGSTDAAATIRAILRLRDQTGLHHDRDWRKGNLARLLALGADVPVCLAADPSRMRGVGERVDPAGQVPRAHFVLVNPRVTVPTPAVFKALALKHNTPMPDTLPIWSDVVAMARWLAEQRNDLELPAITIAPVISDVLKVLGAQSGVLIARMSGSGATCYGLFSDPIAAIAAVAAIKADRPNWWAAAGPVLRA